MKNFQILISMASSSFQLNSKSIFLTFPKCDYSLLEFLEKIEAFFAGNLDKGVICQEKHQDGTFHLHAAICLERPFRSRDQNVFNSLVVPAKHPNIQSRFTGGMLKAFQYVMKEGNYLALNEPKFNLKEFMEAASKKKSTRAKIVAEELIEARKSSPESVNEVMMDHADYMLMNLKKVEAFNSWLEMRDKRLAYAAAQQLPVHVSPVEDYCQYWNQEIASWLNLNLRKNRPHRMKQLWICAPPGMGKTSLIMNLEKDFKLSTYFWPKDEKWWDGYEDFCYDLIVLDEFFTQKTITELNPILSGDPVPLSRRGKDPLVKRQNLPVIILSNYEPEECFARVASNQPHKIAPLLDRLRVVVCKGPIRLAPSDQPTTTVTVQDTPTVSRVPNSPNMVSSFIEISDHESEEITEDSLETIWLDADGLTREERFNWDNDPDYFNKVSRQSRATLIASRNK